MRNFPTHDYRQASLFAPSFCQADKICPLVKPEDKLLVREPCPGNHINMVDCNCPDIDLYIEEVGGLSFDNKSIITEAPLITEPIPVIPREWFDRPSETIPHEIVGIRLGDILSHSPRYAGGVLHLNNRVTINPSALKWPVFQNKKVILFATGPDVVIEPLWHKRGAINMYEEIAKMGFYAVTGMNFSLFLHECPLGQLINLNKSLMFCSELSMLGVSVIPHIYAVNDTQRALWVAYLQHHSNLSTVLINTQLQRDLPAKKETALTVKSLLGGTNSNIILNGQQLDRELQGTSKNRIIAAHQFNLKRRAFFARHAERRLDSLVLENRMHPLSTGSIFDLLVSKVSLDS